MRGFVALGSLLTVLVGWLCWAAPARAERYVHALAVVEWQGTNCVLASGPSMGNRYIIGTPSTTCVAGYYGAVHSASWDQNGYSGQYVGIDPIMGDNNWISCVVYVNGRVEKTDYASAGDGSDVNCLRVVNY